jgi:neutral ceramidase
MRINRPYLCGLALLALLTITVTPLSAQEGASSPWKAGVASAVITPQQSMWMAGYAARTKPSEGTAQDLYAKALALEDAQGTRMVIVTTDLIGILRSVRDVVEKRVGESYHLPPEALLLNASHTHCGPEYRGREGREEESRKYTAFLEETLVQLVGKAIENLAPARVTYSHAHAGFAMNRRLPTDQGFRNSPNSDGPVDHDVPTLIVAAPNGALRAVLFGYACHNTTLSFYEFCGDYAGYAQEYLQAAHPGMTALFLMGCGGDQNPYPRRTLELAKQHGRTLATAVEAAIEASPKPVHGPLRRAFADVEIIRTGEQAGPFPYPVQVVQFGPDITLAALGSEVVVDYSLRLKRELKALEKDSGRAIWIAGYSNGMFGYIPSVRVLREGGYEAGPWDPVLEDRIVNKVHDLNRSLNGTPEAGAR